MVMCVLSYGHVCSYGQCVFCPIHLFILETYIAPLQDTTTQRPMVTCVLSYGCVCTLELRTKVNVKYIVFDAFILSAVALGRV